MNCLSVGLSLGLQNNIALSKHQSNFIQTERQASQHTVHESTHTLLQAHTHLPQFTSIDLIT